MKTRDNISVMTKLERRIIDISYKKGLSHIGSCLTAVRLIDAIYLTKTVNDIFILSSGHAALALYIVLEKFEKQDAEKLFDLHGVHPNRDTEHGIYASSGSLGHGLGIAVGMAVADKTRDVFVLCSDGEMAEGSCWETLRIASELKLDNLKVMVNSNGFGANGRIDQDWLDMRLQYFYPTLVQRTNLYAWPEYMQGLSAHYHVLTKEEYEALTR